MARGDELRGGMDASQYKDYVLVLLFMKYVSDKAAATPTALIEVPEGGSFDDMVKVKNNPEIGDKLNKIITKLAEANDLKGIITTADFNDSTKLGDGQEKIDKLSNLITIFQNPALDFRKNRADGDDLLGDAYEYLMRHFATESGKSKGQFYTPAEVSRIMAQIIGIDKADSPSQILYDPTCGSGSLLLKAADEAPVKITIYGQENDIATRALAKMNMILHDNATAIIEQGNTLANPIFREQNGGIKRVDFAVANPPFSSKAWTTGFNPNKDEFGRFEDGVPPQKNGDYAFLQHLLRSLKSTGKGAIILPHGVLFRGNTEGEIRKSIVRKGYIKGIIGLPPNLFYGTGIPACIIVVDKENAAVRKGIFMIDASKDFVKDGNKNRLRQQDIHRIVDVFTRQLDTPKYARMVSRAEIEANDYNLNLPRYIDSTAPEDVQDIEAHLLGGIPLQDVDDLQPYWEVFPTLQAELFSAGARQGYKEVRVAADEVKPTIFTNGEFVRFQQSVMETFAAWQARHRDRLYGIQVGERPKALIAELSEELLHTYTGGRLIDRYDIYQHLMAYWAETMQDDVYLIAVDGWREATKLRLLVELKGKKLSEKPDFVRGKSKYKADLIPPALIIQRYFAEERTEIDTLQAAQEDVARRIEELEEEHGGEEGLITEGLNDKGKATKSTLTKRIREIGLDPDFADERILLNEVQALLDEEALYKRKVKDAENALDALVFAKYGALSEDEVKTLVVDDKWLPTLTAAVRGELDRLSQTLTGRVKTLTERYSTPLPQLTNNVAVLSNTIKAHLQTMGFVWK